jgi:hypothetical protein
MAMMNATPAMMMVMTRMMVGRPVMVEHDVEALVVE